MLKAKLTRNQLFFVVCLALTLITATLYGPALHHDFIGNYDDDSYITGNPHVTAGLSWSGITWAFQSGYAANWHPLTWISHMLDCQWFGLNPAGHHAVNLLFHIANTLLLFLWLGQATGALWRSAFVAALFAWHPLHVESVAWAAERKDVLSAFFWMLTLIAYTRYSQDLTADPQPAARPASFRSRVTGHGSLYYGLALFLFACGLMSKPMVVTLPFVLLLLDFWPLNRFRPPASPRAAAALLVEKLPFFALALAGSAITYLVQQTGGAMWSLNSLPLGFRMANGLLTYLRYISKTFCPTNLALIYPYPHHWPVGLVIGAALVLAMWSGLFIWRAQRNPYLFTGWFWYLGTLVPTLGLVQVGVQSMADRYTYLPGIGLFMLVVWGLNDWLNLRPQWRPLVTAVGTAALAGCLVGTELQLRYWQNSLKLFLHTVEITTDNYAADNCLGNVLEKAGRKEDALALYTESVRVEPDFPMGQFNLGMMLLANGRLEEASNHLEIAARLMPHQPEVQYDFGSFLSQHSQPEAALGHFNAALDQKPDFPEALNGAAWILSTASEARLRSGQRAVQLAGRACELTQNQQPVFLTTLSAAYAEAGRFADAMATAQKARDFAHAAGRQNIAGQDEELLKLYQTGQPFRETH